MKTKVITITLILSLFLISSLNSQDLSFDRNSSSNQRKVSGTSSNNSFLFRHETSPGNIKRYQDLFTTQENAPDWNWAFTMGGTGGAIGRGIIYDAGDNYYITGYFNGKVNFGNTELTSTGLWDMFFAKYNSSGTALWAKKVSAAPYEIIQGIEIGLDNSNNVYISGNFSGTVTIGSNVLISSGGQDVFLAKFDNTGNSAWALGYGFAGDQELSSSSTDINGNSYLTLVDVNNSLNNTYVKYDNSGQQIWGRSTSASINDIICSTSGMYITGYIMSAITFGTTTLTSGVYPSFFVAKADINGNFIWAMNGTSNWGDSRGYSIALDNTENVYVSGCFTDTIHFATGNYLISNPYDYSVFAAKYTSAGNCTWSSQLAENNFDYTNSQVALDVTGNLFIFGYGYAGFIFGSSQVAGPGNFMAKYNLSGSPQWAMNEDYNPSKSLFSSTDKMIQTGALSYNTFVKQSNNAGNLLWTASTTSDGGMADSWYTIDVDNNGYSYVQGHYDGRGDFLGYPLQGHGAFIAKISGDRQLRWITPFNTGSVNQTVDPSGVAHDNVGDFYAWGTFSDSLTIDGHFLVNPYSSSSFGVAGYLVKFDKECFYQWSRTFASSMSLIGVGGITTDNLGNVIITGNFVDSLFIGAQTFVSNGGQDFFFAKYSTDGTLLFAKSVGGNSTDWGRSISTDGQNNIYITGIFGLSVNFGTTTLTSLGSSDIFLAKYKPNGDEIWAVQAGSTSRERAHSIATDNSGNSYICGLFYGNQMTFGSITITSPYNNNLFVAKYSPAGIPLWARAIRSVSYTWPAYQVGLDNAGNCYIGGDYQDSLRFETGELLSGANNNHFVAKYTTNGTLAWSKNIIGANMSSLLGIAAFAENSVLVSGRIYNEALTFGTTTISSANSNAFLALVGNDLPTSINPPVVKEESGIYVFPNPASKTIFLKFKDRPGKSVTYSLIDVSGKIVYSNTVVGSQSIKIDLPELSAGVYFLSVKTGDGSYFKKVVIY